MMLAFLPWPQPRPDEPKPHVYPKCPGCGREWHGLPQDDCDGQQEVQA